MTDWAAQAQGIHAAFADPITYDGAGLSAEPISATKCDSAGEAYQGLGATLRHIWFEVRKADLPQEPGRDTIIHTDRMTGVTTTWTVIDKVSRDDIGAWELTVEEQ